MKKRTMTKLPWLLTIAILAVMLVYGFWPERVGVDLSAVTRGSLEVTVNDEGETRIREKYVVSTPISGKLLRLQLHVGDVVEQNVTELAYIRPNDPTLHDARMQAEFEALMQASEAASQQADATLARANETLELAQHDYDRSQRLLDKNAISQADFDSAEHGLRIAEADVRSAEFGVKVAAFELNHARAAAGRYDVSDGESAQNALRLISPINGQVLRVFLEDAGAVAAATPLIELGDPQDLEIEIDVLSSDAVKIHPGDKVYLEHWGGDTTLEGVVRIVEPSAFLKVSALGVEEKRVNVIADFAGPRSFRSKLGDGFRIEARIVVVSTPVGWTADTQRVT